MRILAIAVLLFASNAATANECIRIDADLDRLACYDRLSGRTPAPTVQPSAGSWNVFSEKSALTDQTTVIMSVPSNETINCGWNKGAKIELTLRCMENKTVAYFATGCHMTDHGGYGQIDYRVDSEKARKVNGDSSTDNKALGLWGGASITFIKQMLGKKQVVVRMTPFSESPFTATFNITGLEESIKPLRKECRW